VSAQGGRPQSGPVQASGAQEARHFCRQSPESAALRGRGGLMQLRGAQSIGPCDRRTVREPGIAPCLPVKPHFFSRSARCSPIRGATVTWAVTGLILRGRVTT
jgi:hypothetical protein